MSANKGEKFVREVVRDLTTPARLRERLLIATCVESGGLKWPDALKQAIDSAELFQDPSCRAVASALKAASVNGIIPTLPDIAAKLPADKLDLLFSFHADEGLPLSCIEPDAEKFLATAKTQGVIATLADFYQAAHDHPEQAEAIGVNARSALDYVLARSFSGLPEILDAADFLAQSLAMPPELVAGILHRGSKLALGGNSKAFKTWLLLDMAIAVATGSPWLGFPTIRGKVLYVNFEIQAAPMQRRIAAVTRAKEAEMKAGQIQVWNLRGHAADFRQLIPKIITRAKSEGFALIILDPLYKLLGSADENAARDIAELLNAIERLAVETGAAVAYANHFAKGNASGKEAQDRISGSGVFARDPDSLIIFTAHQTEGSFTVETILRNFAPVAPFVVSWQFPLMQRDDDLDPADLKQQAGRKREHDPVRLLALIADNDDKNPVSISDWALAGNIKRQTLTEYLPEMRRNGWIKTIGQGTAARQAITSNGKDLLKGAPHDGN